MQNTIPYPFKTNEELEPLKGSWEACVKRTHADATLPRRLNERSEYFYQRGNEHLKITTWRAAKEAPSGGYTVSARVSYVGPAGFAATKDRAGGGGYCKESAATAGALSKFGNAFVPLARMSGCGMSSIENTLAYLGFQRV